MPDWPEDEFVFVSAIEHYSYCPRQCALIHVEHVFDENLYTLRGHDAHERVHEGPPDDEDGKRVERGLPIWSARLGLDDVGFERLRKKTVAIIDPEKDSLRIYRLGARREECVESLGLDKYFDFDEPMVV